MKINNETLRGLFMDYADSKKQTDQKGCPSSDDIVNSFERSTSRRKKRKIIDHITRCSFCREEFMLCLKLREHAPTSIMKLIENELFEFDTGKDKRKDRLASSFRKYAYALLSLGIIVSLVFLLFQQKELSEIQRARETGILLIYPTSVHVLKNSLTFKWQMHLIPQYYVLELFDEALLPIWTSNKIYDTQIELPKEICQVLQHEKSYFWMITAFSDMQKIEESRLTRFLVLKKKE